MSQPSPKLFFEPTDPTDWRVSLDPDEPGIGPAERAGRRALVRMAQKTHEELFQQMVRAGIYTPDGELTERYRSDEPEPAATARCPHCKGVLA